MSYLARRGEEYAEKYTYVWEYAYSLEVTELDYSQERSALTQSRIFSDVIEECLKPQKLNPTGEGDRFCGIICSTSGKEDGYQLAVCKQLGSASVNGMENIAVILYDEQGRLVDSEYYMCCDQDDVWLPEKIEKSVEKITRVCYHYNASKWV